MKILIVANNKTEHYASFIEEQVNSLRNLGVDVDYFGVFGKGIVGYLKCLPELNRKIRTYQPDILHAHYGLSGLLANLQRKIPVVTTYHGSDIHSLGLNLRLSKLSMRLSAYNIFVSQYLQDIAKYKGDNYVVQACGLDMNTIMPVNMADARDYFGWNTDKKYILFSGSFSNYIKNVTLAQEAIKQIKDTELVELKGYTRVEVSMLMSACDCLLLTSFREASPTVIKEAMACNRPIVTTNVGDASWVIGDTDGCYITSYDAEECADKIKQAFEFSSKYLCTNGRNRIVELGLDTKTVAAKIFEIYNLIYKKS
ncbi:MAG: glycosyltransferase [bacterium]